MKKYIFNVIGEYNLIFYVEDSSNNQAELVLLIIVSEDEEVEIIFTGYYEDLNGLEDNELLNTLYTILNTFNGVFDDDYTTTYGQARDYLIVTDAWIGYDTKYVRLIYTNTLKGSVYSGYPEEGPASTVWDNGATWNREHVWAKSLLGSSGYDADNNTRGIAADLHNLRAADTTVNSTRNNNKFSNQTFIQTDSNGNDFGNYNGMWYPGHNHRGDVARIIFYMDIRWGSETTISKIGDLNTFIAWHLADPVDDFELNRNQKIFEYQGNRNPFIDHPELVNMIYVN